MPALDGLRVWIESSDNPDGLLAKELECYTVKHIEILKTVTAYVESTVEHYFHVCFSLPNDLEDGVNVDIEIDGLLCAELYRDAKDWTHRCSGTIIEAASERPFQFKEATLVEDDDERVLKDEHIIKNAGSIRLTFYKAKILACKPVNNDQILKPNHDEKIYSEKDKKAMSHSIGFGEARTIPSMEFCHSESSDPDNIPFATFIFYYRSRALLEALNHIKAVEHTPEEASETPPENGETARNEGNTQANDEDDEELPALWPRTRSRKNTAAAMSTDKLPASLDTARPAAASSSILAPVGPTTSTSASASTSTSSSASASSSLPSTSSSSSPPPASSHLSRPSLTTPTSSSGPHNSHEDTIVATGRKGDMRKPHHGESDTAGMEGETSTSISRPGPSAVSIGKKRTREIEQENEEEDELPDEDHESPPKSKVKIEEPVGTSTSAIASTSAAGRSSETVESMQDKIERLEAANRLLQKQAEKSRHSHQQGIEMDVKPVVRLGNPPEWIIDLTADSDDD